MLAIGPRRGIDWAAMGQFGAIRRRQDGRLYLDFGRAGKLYSAHGSPFETERQAQIILDAVRVVVAQGTDRQRALDRWLPSSSVAHRVSVWYERWLTRQRELVASGELSCEYVEELERWGRNDGHVCGYWGRRSVHGIDYAALEEWARWLADRRIGAKTRRNVMGSLHAMMGWLVRVGELASVPPFPWPRVQEHAPTILSPQTQARVLEEIPESRRGIFLALALLGLRPSEATRLRAADYTVGEPGWLTITRTKNGEAKRLPVPAELADWIARHVPVDARLSQAPLFALAYRGHGRRARAGWCASSLRRDWRMACDAVGVRCSLYEGTKHSRATELLLAGVPERTLQVLLGHRDARSTRRYARLADSALVEALAPRGSNVDPASNRGRK